MGQGVRLLVVGPAHSELARAAELAAGTGAAVTHVAQMADAFEHLRARGADLAMVELTVGIKPFIAGLRAERIQTEVIACAIQPEAMAAAAAIKAGASEFVPLPADAEIIAEVLLRSASVETGIIATDPGMAPVMTALERAAGASVSVLITGESGTGKEVFARALHSRSKRHAKPFVAINCAAIPEALLESELFGHEKGAFTGAIARRIGRFEEAAGGTLLLDEITEMPVTLQAKLLRVLQERVVTRVGGRGEVPVDVRVIATSNRDVGEAIREGSFRQDLFYRLNVVNLALPALRERRADIAVLANHFIERSCEAEGLRPKRLSASAAAALTRYDFPGNVRELENIVARAVVMAPGAVIELSDLALPATASDTAASPSLVGRSLEEIEQRAILETLAAVGGNQTRAAAILRITTRTIRNKLDAYEVRHGIAR